MHYYFSAYNLDKNVEERLGQLNCLSRNYNIIVVLKSYFCLNELVVMTQDSSFEICILN